MSLDILPPLQGAAVPPFSNARTARDWLKLLPLINIPQAQDELFSAISELNNSHIDALESLRIIEQLRESVHLVQTGLLADYMDARLPLSGKAQKAWLEAQALWEAFEKAYARCWRAAIEGQAEIVEYMALLAERTLYYGRMRVRGELLVHRQVSDALWQKLYAYHALTVSTHVSEQKAKDSLIELGSTTTPQAMFVHSLLLATIRSNRLSSKQIIWIDARLEFFAQRAPITPDAKGIPDRLPLTLVPARPCAPVRGAQELSGPDFVHIETRTLGQSLSKRIKLLREGELPQNLGLGSDLSGQAAETLLAQCYRTWCETPTSPLPTIPANAPHKPVALGFENQHNDVSGGKFRTYQEHDPSVAGRDVLDLQLFGRTVSKQMSAARPPVQREEWRVLQESAQGLWLLRPENSAHPIELQDLLLIHSGDQKLLAVVRAINEIAQGVIVLLQLLPGQPFPAQVRARDGGRFGQNEFAPAMILPPVTALRSAVSLILPRSWYRHGRMLELWDGQNLVKIRLEQLLERGADHDRSEFAVV